MKKTITLLTIIALFALSLPCFAQAPNAGDGIPDGSGLDPTHGENSNGPGPAPNSGDGVPDGNGF